MHGNSKGPAMSLEVESEPIRTTSMSSKTLKKDSLKKKELLSQKDQDTAGTTEPKPNLKTDANHDDPDSFLCQETLFYSSWEKQFEAQWMSKNRNEYKNQESRKKALEQAKTDAFIRLVYPSIEKAGYDFPMEINSQVLAWIRYFSGPGRKHFVVWLRRGQNLIPQMNAILEKQGLPKDLVYLSMIESGFNPTALSTASAVGLWQFRAITANEYGLQMNHWIDERRDPIKSTKAAARLLTNLYATFGSWHLAAASYNCGPGCVRRTLKNYGETSSYFELTSKGVINKQTAEYVPKIIAAMIVAKNPEKFGFDSKDIPNLNQTKTISVGKSVSLADLASSLHVDKQILEQLNPQLKMGITPPSHALPSGKFDLTVPASKYELALAKIDALPDASLKRVLVARSKHKSRSDFLATKNRYRVSLASAHGKFLDEKKLSKKSVVKENTRKAGHAKSRLTAKKTHSNHRKIVKN